MFSAARKEFAMSGLGSISSSSTAQYLQQLASSSAASESSPNTADDTPDDATQDSQAVGGAIDFSSLRAQLEAAIQAALQGSTANDTGSALTKIKTAVDTTLQAAGIDPAQLKSALSAGGAAATGAAGAQPGQDLVSILNALDQAGDSASTLDGLLGAETGDDASAGTTDLSALLSGDSTATSSTGAASNDGLLTQLYAQLFQNFPNGSGLDASA